MVHKHISFLNSLDSFRAFVNEIIISIGSYSLNQLDTIFATCISWLSGFLVFFAPAGLGYREASLNLLLEFLSTGLIKNIGIIVILFRIMTLVGELAWVIFGVLNFRRQNYSNSFK